MACQKIKHTNTFIQLKNKLTGEKVIAQYKASKTSRVLYLFYSYLKYLAYFLFKKNENI